MQSVVFDFELQIDPVSQTLIDLQAYVIDQTAQADRFQHRTAWSCEAKDLFGHAASASHALDDVSCRRAKPRVADGESRNGFSEGLNAHQYVVELVRHGCGQLTQTMNAPGLLELRLKMALVGQLQKADNNSFLNLAVDQRCGDFNRHRLAVLMNEDVFPGVADFSGLELSHPAVRRTLSGRMDHGVEVAAQKFL